MAAVHAIPLNTIASSVDIQAGLKARVLTGRADTLYFVKKCIINIAGQVKAIIIGVLREKKAEGMRFAIVLDEWTSVGNCKYMNVIIFWGKDIFLTWVL